MLTFRITGKPVPKGRPRFGRGRTYTPKTTQDYEARVAEAAAAAMKEAGIERTDAQVRVRMSVRVAIPKSYKGKKWMDAASGVTTPSSDLDNHIKAVLDGMNGVVWDDDRQVVMIAAQKGWAGLGQEEGVSVEVRSASQAA